jgi:putative ABC transport system substrate-binding protein
VSLNWVRTLQRREFISLLGGAAAAWPLAARAQQAGRLPTIGFMGTDATLWSPWTTAFLARLRELGWVEGRTIAIEFRWNEGRPDRMAEIAAEFIRLNVNLIVANASAVLTLKQVTSAIPIVFVLGIDPVGSGFVASFSRPGGNVTGFNVSEPTLAGKFVELLKEIAPHVARVAMLFNPASATYAEYWLNPFKAAATSFAVEAITAPVRDGSELDSVVAAQARESNSGLIAMPDSFMDAHRVEITSLAARYRLPAVYNTRVFAEVGGLRPTELT